MKYNPSFNPREARISLPSGQFHRRRRFHPSGRTDFIEKPVGGSDGFFQGYQDLSRLRARAAPALTAPRAVIHYRGPSNPSSEKNHTEKSVWLFSGISGFEPETTESKSVVLPLHHIPAYGVYSNTTEDQSQEKKRGTALFAVPRFYVFQLSVGPIFSKGIGLKSGIFL